MDIFGLFCAFHDLLFFFNLICKHGIIIDIACDVIYSIVLMLYLSNSSNIPYLISLFFLGGAPGLDCICFVSQSLLSLLLADYFDQRIYLLLVDHSTILFGPEIISGFKWLP